MSLFHNRDNVFLVKLIIIVDLVGYTIGQYCSRLSHGTMAHIIGFMWAVAWRIMAGSSLFQVWGSPPPPPPPPPPPSLPCCVVSALYDLLLTWKSDNNWTESEADGWASKCLFTRNVHMRIKNRNSTNNFVGGVGWWLGEIIYPFPNNNDVIVETWKWISNFVPHFTEHVITYPCCDQS